MPGFIDAHMHIESCMAAPGELAKVLAKAGTTTIIADPHEIVNVSGTKGMDYFLKCAAKLLVNVFFMVPSAVPATDVETNGCGEFLASDMMKYVDNARVLGLGETMRFMECCEGEKRMADKLELFAKKHIDGHAPGIRGKEVQAYRLAGVENDHECSTAEEVLDKLRAGLHIYVREASGAKNLETLIKTMLDAGVCLDRCAFCTDDKHVEEIRKEGHISTCIRKAIALGVPVAKAYKMGSYQAAEFYGLKNYGAIGAGYRADIVFLDDLEQVRPLDVMKDGRILTEEDYEKNRLQVYKFLLDAASDGMASLVLPGTKKLGDERTSACSIDVEGDGILMDEYRDRKLLDRYLEPIALKNDLQLQDIRLVMYLSQPHRISSRKELMDYTNMTKNTLSASLQRLISKGIVKIEELKVPIQTEIQAAQQDSAKKTSRRGKTVRKLEITLLPAADSILKSLSVAENDYEQARYADLTDEEIVQYAYLNSKIKQSIQKIL